MEVKRATFGPYERIGRLLTTDHSPLNTVFDQYSNRQSYEKLEVELTPLPSIKLLFLIDTKTHFVQGKNAQCSLRPACPDEGMERSEACLRQAGICFSPAHMREGSLPAGAGQAEVPPSRILIEFLWEIRN